jgi:outer membrane protein assembly factor BamC
LPVLLAGCSWLPDHTTDYQLTEPARAMKVPQGMYFEGEQPLYTVPQVESRVHSDDPERVEVPPPPKLDIVMREALDAEAERPDPTQTRIVLARDGNGYPNIMMYIAFQWAWEYVGQALEQTDITVDDRDRESGVFFVEVPRSYGLDDKEAQVKLSHTSNGVQIVVMDRKGNALVDKGPGQDILQALYDKL